DRMVGEGFGDLFQGGVDEVVLGGEGDVAVAGQGAGDERLGEVVGFSRVVGGPGARFEPFREGEGVGPLLGCLCRAHGDYFLCVRFRKEGGKVTILMTSCRLKSTSTIFHDDMSS